MSSIENQTPLINVINAETPNQNTTYSAYSDENPDSLCEAKREVLIFDSSPRSGVICGAVAGFRRNAGVSPNSAPKAQEEEMRR
jgi:hypothetical protein